MYIKFLSLIQNLKNFESLYIFVYLIVNIYFCNNQNIFVDNSVIKYFFRI